MPPSKKTKAPKASKKSKTTSASTPVEEVVAAETVVAEPVAAATTTTTTTVVAEEVDDSLTSSFKSVLDNLSALKSAVTSAMTEVRTLQKSYERERKQHLKASRRRKTKAGNRAPSGFVIPTEISQELATFLKKPSGTEMKRTDVTKEINKYIREHKLQDPTNGRKILPDAKLRKLLRVPQNEELTYFNLQRYMSPHFPKSKKAAAAAAASSSTTMSTSA
jgi:chromatin remodeling complex protein RSC6